MSARIERLKEAQAALFIGFSAGCGKRGLRGEATIFYNKAIKLCPTIFEIMDAEPIDGPQVMSSITMYGQQIAHSEDV